MKKHRVIFINGPAEGQDYLLNPHYTRISVVHPAGPGRQGIMTVVRAQKNTELTVTDASVAITDYTISELHGETDYWYVAVMGGASCQDRLLAIILGKITGEGYATGYHEGAEILNHYTGDPLRKEENT